MTCFCVPDLQHEYWDTLYNLSIFQTFLSISTFVQQVIQNAIVPRSVRLAIVDLRTVTNYPKCAVSHSKCLACILVTGIIQKQFWLQETVTRRLLIFFLPFYRLVSWLSTHLNVLRRLVFYKLTSILFFVYKLSVHNVESLKLKKKKLREKFYKKGNHLEENEEKTLLTVIRNVTKPHKTNGKRGSASPRSKLPLLNNSVIVSSGNTLIKTVPIKKIYNSSPIDIMVRNQKLFLYSTVKRKKETN